MNILIIYTYPNHQSFNSAILKVVQQNLSKDHNVKTLDLYEEVLLWGYYVKVSDHRRI